MQNEELICIQSADISDVSVQMPDAMPIGAVCNIVSLAITCFVSGLMAGARLCNYFRKKQKK